MRARAIVIGLAIPVVASLLLLAQPRARATLRLVQGFSALDSDPRIRFEDGAEDLARAVADALPEAIARVEACQATEFEKPFRVYVCATHESFSRRIGQSARLPVRGIAFLRDIWISPKAWSFHGRDTHRETIAHELSHLHLGQVLGSWHRIKEIPSWFQEGIADWVADTGHEQVSRESAREAILGGHAIELDESGHLPLPKRPESYGMTWPMFHAQSRMFVEYVRARDRDAFGGFMAAVMRGARFAPAFEANLGWDIRGAWDDFVVSLETGS